MDLALTVTVAASTMFTVASIPDLNGSKRAMHAVAIVLTISHATGHAAVDVVHLPPPYAFIIRNFSGKYPKAH